MLKKLEQKNQERELKRQQLQEQLENAKQVIDKINKEKREQQVKRHNRILTKIDKTAQKYEQSNLSALA